MKKGLLFRLLVVVLVCSMLFGLVGFTSWTELGAANVTTVEPQAKNVWATTEEPAEDPGESGEDPAEEPGGEQEEEPGEDPAEEAAEGFKVTVEQPVGGTIELVPEEDAEEPADYTVDANGVITAAEGTKLKFAVKADEGAKLVNAYVTYKEAGNDVNDTATVDENDSTFVVTVDKDITVSAEFLGISSVEVSYADEWAKSKTVTVETFGATDVQLVGAEGDSKYIELVSSKDGVYEFKITKDIGETAETFTVTAKNGAAEVTKTEGVKMIDTKAPVVSFGAIEESDIKEKGWDCYDVTWTITETGSGVALNDKGEFDIQFVKDSVKDSGTRADVAQDSFVYNPETGELTFRVMQWYYNGLKITVKDNAGNTAEYYAKDFRVTPYVEIVGVSKGTWDETGEFYWAGYESVLQIYANSNVTLNIGTASEVADTDEPDEPGVKQYDAAITASGEYQATVSSETGSKFDTVNIKYDPTAPVIDSATYNDSASVDQGWLKTWLNKLTGGLLFNNGFSFNIQATDNEGGSGIYKYAYIFVKEGESVPTAPNIRDEAAAKENGWIFATPDDKGNIVVEHEGEFTGTVYVCVWDKAENATVKAIEVGADGDTIISNATDASNNATYNNDNTDPQLTVMAYYTDDGKEVAYTGAWTQQVNFKIGVDLTNLPEDATNVVLKASYVNEKTQETVTKQIAEPTENAEYTFSIGGVGNDDVAVNGTVTFKLYYDLPEYGDNPATTDVTETDYLLDTKTIEEPVTTAVTEVHVQNYLNAATVETKGTPTDDGWYNAQDNQLTSATIVGCDSTAPYTTHYTVSYQTYYDYVNKNKPDLESEDVKTYTFGTGELDEDGNVVNAKEAITDADLKSLMVNPGVYTVEVWSEDAAGNTNGTEENPATYTFKVDEELPVITAFFTNDGYEKHEQLEGEQLKDYYYYNTQQTITIRISDASFTGDENIDNITSFVDTISYTAVNGDKAKVEDKDYTWDKDTKCWIVTFVFGTDTEKVTFSDSQDGNDYGLEVSVTDNAGNTVYTDRNGVENYDILNENGKKELTQGRDDCYTKLNKSKDELAKIFTMDQTDPVVTVTYSTDDVKNDRYFNDKAGRTVTITVVEHNFYEAGATITTVNESKESGWVKVEGKTDTYQKTIEFKNEGECKFEISVKDLAGNVADVKYISEAPEAHNDFVIDRIDPEFRNVTTGTYDETCNPGFTGTDTNISSKYGAAEYTVRLTRSVRNHLNEDVTARFASSDATLSAAEISAIYANIPDDAANDGIYTLSVSVTDLAGNTSDTSSTFTVNRHGSFYVFSEDLAELVNAKFVQKADGEYSVTEYNASPLVPGSVKIEIYRDDQLIETLAPTIGAGAIGELGLYEYTYDLDAKYFAEDGRYKIVLSSEDEAENVSENTKLEDADIQFVVDTVAPEIVLIEGLEKARVNAEELEFKSNVTDTYGIATIEIFVDGNLAKVFADQSVYDSLKAKGEDMSIYEVLENGIDVKTAYTLLESNAKQSIEIKVTDMAGNVTTTADEDFDPVYDFHDSVLVSTNFFARYIHNPLALIGTGVVVAGAVWLVLSKKKNEEKTAA